MKIFHSSILSGTKKNQNLCIGPKNDAERLINFEAKYTGCYFLLVIVMCIVSF
jgi:hypothetical protein